MTRRRVLADRLHARHRGTGRSGAARHRGAAGALAVLLVAVALAPPSAALGADRYVDASAAPGGDGSSWARAWHRLGGIDWSALGPGDTVHVSGGTYDEGLVVQASGSAAAPLTIAASGAAGHDGIVRLRGRTSRGVVVEIRDRSHVVVRGFDLAGAACAAQGTVHLTRAEGVVVEDMVIDVQSHGGVFVQESTACVVRANRMTTAAAAIPCQTDGIYAQRNSGNVYEDNDIVIRNTHPDPHCDAIQMFREDGATVRGNYLEQDNTKENNAQGLYVTTSTGLFRIYNNVVVCPHTRSSLIGVLNVIDGSVVGTAEVEVYNNTVYGRSSNLIHLAGFHPVVVNNVVVRTVDGVALYFEQAIAEFSALDHNLVFTAGDGAPIYYAPSGALSWSEWQALGAEAHGLRGDPLLDAAFRPTAGSPAVDSGADLGLVFSTDRDGLARPQGTAWDRGAYELAAEPPPCSELGGSCCAVGQACAGGALAASADCGSRCCLGGACEAVTAECEPAGLLCCAACAAGTEAPDRDPACGAERCCGLCAGEAFAAGRCVEAEWGALVAPMAAVADPEASLGSSVTSAEGAGSVTFTFEVGRAGLHVIDVLARTPPPAEAHDSFFVGDDEAPASGDARVFDLVDSETFAWDRVRLRGEGGTPDHAVHDPMSWDLAPGRHSFTFAAREPLAALDRLVLRPCPAEGCEALVELGCPDEPVGPDAGPDGGGPDGGGPDGGPDAEPADGGPDGGTGGVGGGGCGCAHATGGGRLAPLLLCLALLLAARRRRP